ncbi:threonine-phosphate decarboxylase CobD [Inediibacterium massiliense]|uniref:threonine-phosphate decarboxylase CobD n=1 Tax=Inediibacterium massiliense TaxID=1658111 RepID=UPI0006B62608|nr:threonine-phosphate decarboxylase CobD [Inediibacterium massiliense]
MKRVEHGGNIYEIAQRLGIQEEEIIDFSANINPLGIPKDFKECMILNIDTIQKYPDPKYKDLIKDISEYHKINSNWIVVGNGATEVIFSMIREIKPKNSLILAPTFLEYERALKKARSNVEYYLLKEENNFQIDDDFFNILHDSIDLLILCNPNNPTSQLIAKSKMEKILNICKSRNIHVMIDEAFMEFVENGEKESVISLLKDYDHLYIIKALTKFYALPGLRIGYGLSSNIKILEEIKNNQEPWSINSYAAMAGMVLKDEYYIQKSKEWIIKERKKLYEELLKIKNLKVYPPSSNYILFKYMESNKNLKEALLKRKILIRSCDNYKNLDDSFYRIAIKDEESNLKLLNALKEVSYED